MKYVYPAVFTLSDEGYAVEFPDLPGCFTCGDTLANAIEMAEDASELWLSEAERVGREIPEATKSLSAEAPSFINYVCADTEAYHRKHDNRAVKKTLTIPAWLNHAAEEAHLNFSGVLQEALKSQLNI
jgi:predicted RNase H-like HicB family nuclease